MAGLVVRKGKIKNQCVFLLDCLIIYVETGFLMLVNSAKMATN